MKLYLIGNIRKLKFTPSVGNITKLKFMPNVGNIRKLKFTPSVGLEPTTLRLRVSCSTD